eukprot:56992_1
MAYILYSCRCMIQLILFNTLFAQPTYIYDGVSTVELSGAQNDGTTFYNWTAKYPLGELCEDPNWVTSVNIWITKLTVQGDLVLAFGSSKEYFALTIPYDGVIWIPLTWPGKRTDQQRIDHQHGLSVAPKPNSKLFTATTTLEDQYTTDTDFRRSLIPSKSELEWHKLLERDSPMSLNSTLLTLRIFGDRRGNITQLTVIKNGVNVTTQMSSTWDYNTQVYLYMAMDAARNQQEVFVLSDIERVDECTWATVPRTLSPTLRTLTPSHMPSVSPSAKPSVAPSDSTLNPTRDTAYPSGTPTRFPSVTPSRIPSKMPSLWPSLLPSLSPSYSPSAFPSYGPSVLPSYGPSAAPNEAIVLTNVVEYGDERSQSTSVIEEEESVNQGNINVFELVKTGSREVMAGRGGIYVAIGVGVSMVCGVIFVIICCYKCRKSYTEVEDYDNW